MWGSAVSIRSSSSLGTYADSRSGPDYAFDPDRLWCGILTGLRPALSKTERVIRHRIRLILKSISKSTPMSAPSCQFSPWNTA